MLILKKQIKQIYSDAILQTFAKENAFIALNIAVSKKKLYTFVSKFIMDKN